MKVSTVTAAAMAGVVSAQSVADIPSCAIPCLNTAVQGKTKCGITDFACMCSKENFSVVQAAATSCVIDACGAEKAVGQVLPATQKLCAAALKNAPAASASAAAAPALRAASSPSSMSIARSPSSTPTSSAARPSSKGVASPTGSPAGGNGTRTGTQAGTQAGKKTFTAGAAGLAPVGALALLAAFALAL